MHDQPFHIDIIGDLSAPQSVTALWTLQASILIAQRILTQGL